MKDLAREIDETFVADDAVALWWLGQAGFVCKSPRGTIVYIDPYLSDAVERAFGFKRLSLAPIDAEHVRADWVVSSHEHLDHLDTDALPVIALNNPGCRFAGSDACLPEYDKCAILSERQLIMQPGETYSLADVRVHTVRADHGELSPSALSLLFDFGGVRMLFTGDTALRPDLLQPLMDMKPDILAPCINGTFGNLGPDEAAMLTAMVHPRVVVPCHFWMFKEHNGDPQRFAEACEKWCRKTPVRFLTPGEGILVGASEIDAIA